MGYWDVFGPTTIGSPTLEGELDNSDFHLLEGAVTVAVGIAGALDNLENAHEISGNLQLSVLIAGEILNGGQPGIDAPVTTGPITAAGQLTNFAPSAPVDGDYCELFDRGLLGAWQGCSGPGSTVVIAGESARQLLLLSYADVRRLRVISRVDLGGRPVAITSTKRMPPWDDGNADDVDCRVFVVVEQAENPDAPPKLQCRRMDVSLTLLEEVDLERETDNPILWGPEDDPDATFIVLATRGGGIEIRTADENMAVITACRTGVYRPAVLDVRKRDDLGGAGVDVWHILVFAHTGAQGAILEYRVTDTTTDVLVGATRIVGSVDIGPITIAGEIQQRVVLGLAGAVKTGPITATGFIDTPPIDFSGAVTLRPLSTVFSVTKNLDAIEERITGAVAIGAPTIAGDVENLGP